MPFKFLSGPLRPAIEAIRKTRISSQCLNYLIAYKLGAKRPTAYIEATQILDYSLVGTEVMPADGVQCRVNDEGFQMLSPDRIVKNKVFAKKETTILSDGCPAFQ